MALAALGAVAITNRLEAGPRVRGPLCLFAPHEESHELSHEIPHEELLPTNSNQLTIRHPPDGYFFGKYLV